MSIPWIDNLEIRKVTNEILFVHQIKTPSFFSCCDGLLILPKKDRNKSTIVLDLNIEPKYIAFINETYGPVSHYFCSHGHLDHICHVHVWEQLGVKIHGPIPEANYLLDLNNFYIGFGYNEVMDFKNIESFGMLNRFQPCKRVLPFKPGNSFKFEEFNIHTIPFLGHSKAHVGFFIPSDQILHISCLGYDKKNPEADGFGPWYGFKQCSISQYLDDIDAAESYFLSGAKILTSSHSNIVYNPKSYPFNYMREKIRFNQGKVDTALQSLDVLKTDEEELKNQLLKLDLFFPKRKMKGFMLEIYRFWEYWIIHKHVLRSKYFE